MSEIKHTPGAYVVDEYQNNFYIRRRWDAEVRPINTDTFGSGEGALIATVEFVSSLGAVPTRSQAEANARLIATAPEMLAALEALLMAHTPGTYDAAIDNAKDVIKKAKGEK